MATKTELPVTVHSRNFRELPHTTAFITRVDYDKKERTQNGLKALGIGLGLTFGAALVPIAHWFLAPLAFVGTCIFAIDKLNESARSEGGKGTCPKCGKSFVIEATKMQDRMIDTCGDCHEDLEIRVELTSSS